MHKLSFLLYWPKDAHLKSMRFIGNLDDIIADGQSSQFFVPSAFRHINLNDHNVFIGGDPIYSGDMRRIFVEHNFDLPKILKIIKGHYYLFVINDKNNRIDLSSSFFNMFPVFYYEDDQSFSVSSHLKLISKIIGKQFQINKKYILEQFIFNYPLFDDTIYQGVKLLATNHHIKIADNKISFQKHFDIANCYVSKPISYKKKADYLSDVFISRYKEYIPDSKHYISFTGGFDGRTLLACGHYYGSDFKTFSFGSRHNEDVMVPLQNSKQINIDFQPILLDNKEYIENGFLKTGQENIGLTSGYSNFLYVHSLYAAKLLSRETEYMLTGYFGSELFRALHLTGAFCSRELINFFSETDDTKWIKDLKKSFKLEYLNRHFFKNELDEIIESLVNYKKSQSDFETLNHFFYKYVMEEIFRKVFGPQTFAQFNHVNVRTPFLDFDFIQELFKTDLAGVNNTFFVKNPLKRLKGQYLYAKIISKTFPELARIKTQKGYSPRDLLTTTGKINIVLPFVIKKTKRRLIKPYLDNLSIISGLKQNHAYISNIVRKTNFFDVKRLEELFFDLEDLPETKRDLLALAGTMSYYLNKEQIT